MYYEVAKNIKISTLQRTQLGNMIDNICNIFPTKLYIHSTTTLMFYTNPMAEIKSKMVLNSLMVPSSSYIKLPRRHELKSSNAPFRNLRRKQTLKD